MSDAQRAGHPLRRGPPQLPAGHARWPLSTPSRWRRSQAALKRAIQVEFQLEDHELAAEPLPTADARNVLLFYEAAEGGAGVLRRLVDDPTRSRGSRAAALELCHFDPDRHGSSSAPSTPARTARPPATTACSATATSPTTASLDRTAIRDAAAASSPARRRVRGRSGRRRPREHSLKRRCDSDLERRFLDLLVAERPPASRPTPQKLIAAAQTRPDFVYDERAGRGLRRRAASTTTTDKQADDALVNARLEDLGCDGHPLPPRRRLGRDRRPLSRRLRQGRELTGAST